MADFDPLRLMLQEELWGESGDVRVQECMDCPIIRTVCSATARDGNWRPTSFGEISALARYRNKLMKE